MVTQIFGLKTEENCFFVIQIPVTKIIGKTGIWTIFCFWVSPPNYTNYVRDAAISCTMTRLVEYSL